MRSNDDFKWPAMRVTVSAFARGILSSSFCARSFPIPGSIPRSEAGASVTFAGKNGPTISQPDSPPVVFERGGYGRPLR